ncbi:MAG: Cna B-type domain-containing protein [Lachnospiraceae bacterium]|jgi:hypothetical protein
MQNELLPKAERYIKRRKQFKLWQIIVGVLACVVLLYTTFALILPAITMEQTTYCGMEEHSHGTECFEKRLICGHVEDTEAESLETSEFLETNHVHTDECYEERQVLICEAAETPGHIHDESCIQTEQVLVCTEEHEHTEDCYRLTETYICNLNEGEGGHTHGPECYETQKVLICDLTENEKDSKTSPETRTLPPDNPEVHVHTDACYETVLICEKPEHKHTLACFSNPEADLESRNVWERTVADAELTGVWADDIVAIAQSQLGYEESKANYIVMDDGETVKGYTRYGAWYGNPYDDWCAMFVSFCLNYAHIPETAVPYEASCNNWIKTLSTSDRNIYRSTDEYTPAKGDIVFFDNDGDGISDHAGIVAEFIFKKERIKTIEGNSSNKVKYATYATDDNRICGYGALPERESLTGIGIAETVEIIETTKTAVIYTDGSYKTLSEDETVITLTGIIPQEADVRAFPVTVETEQQVLCAYDISIVMPDGSFYEPAEGEKISVAIRAPGLSNDEAPLNATAYYIPEDSAPVPMDTSIQEDGAVCFEAGHFSVYALMRGTMPEVYLNGATGNDNNAGTQAAPVKSFEQALSLVAENGTIYVSGTVTVSSGKNWSIEVAGVKMQRAAGFTGPLVSVTSGGSLTLSDLTMNGNSGQLNPLLINNNSSYSTAYAANFAKAPLIVVNSGGSLTVTDGTVLEYNSNKPNTDANGAFQENGYIGLGGAVYCKGTMTMTGGLIQHCEAQSGGGIYVENGSFHLSGGTIDHNYARNILAYSSTAATYRKNAGGGVYIGNNSDMIMSGGTVSNNQSSREGGGISLGWLNRAPGGAIYSYTTSFTMTGGTFTGNKALSTGGGLNVTAGREATVSAGYFTGNSAYGYDSQGNAHYGAFRVFSGGGIYVDAAQWNGSGNYAGVPGKLVLHRAVITENHSDYQGGGIAACPTGVSHVNQNLNIGNGTAIYNNSADPALVGSDTEIGIQDKESSDIVTDEVLGGGAYNWSISTYNGYTNYGNDLTDSSPEIVTAKSLATVWITGNHGYLGGGIGNNGVIEVGGETEDDFTSITITKEWGDQYADHPAYITVQILQNGHPYGDPIKIYKTTDEEGREVWPTYYVDGLPAGTALDPYIYTVEEVPITGYDSVVTQDGNNFTITNTRTGFRVMKKWSGDTVADRPETIDVQLLQNNIPYGEPQQLTQANGWFYIWTNLPEKDDNEAPYTYTVQEINVPAGYYISGNEYVDESGMWEITNTKIETTAVSAEKRWAEGTPPADSITLQLKADGQDYGAPVVLNNANNWFYRWDNLPKYTAENAPDGTPIAYTVVEISPSGYLVNIEQADPGQAGPGWTPVTALENGKEYLMVTSEGGLAGSGSYGLQWMDVSNVINNSGASPDPVALWTYNSAGSTLKNGDDKYLVLGDLSGSYVFFTNPASRQVSLANGRLSATGGGYTRYFTGNFDQYSYGTTSTYSSQAILFTFYTQTNNTANWGNIHFIVTNDTMPSSIEVRFSKYSVSGDGGELVLIAGADLALYIQEEAETLIPGTSVTGTLVNQWTSGGVGQDESIHIEDLVQGTYYLVETAVPEGHLGLAGPIIFTVDPANDQVIILQYPGYSSMEGSDLFEEGSAELPIYNSATYVIPETGGPGTIAYIAGGILLTGSAILLLYINKKRRRLLRPPNT